MGIAPGVGTGEGASPIGANLPHGALRSGLALGEVQAWLNPMPVLVIVPTHLSMGGERGVSPASLILWTVVGITLGASPPPQAAEPVDPSS